MSPQRCGKVISGLSSLQNVKIDNALSAPESPPSSFCDKSLPKPQ